MADLNRPGGARAKKVGIITALGVAGVVAAGIAAERAILRRDRKRPDPYKDEPYGTRRGKPLGPVASSDGTLLAVSEAGEGPITLVLSHGFSLNATMWHHQIDGLAADARIVVFDHRGHGRSGKPSSEDWSLQALARDLHAVVSDATGDEPVVLVGHSMGGMAVLEYCRMFPEQVGSKVKGLVLADTTAADVMSGVIPAARRAQAAFQGVQEIVMRALAGRVEAVDRIRMSGSNIAYLGTRLMGFGPDPSPTQVAFVERMLSEVPSDVWVSLMPAIMALDVSDVLPLIDVPVLIVVGSHDRLTPPGAAERLATALPRAELVVVDGAGHTSMLERPDEFNDHVRRFIEGVARDARASSDADASKNGRPKRRRRAREDDGS